MPRFFDEPNDDIGPDDGSGFRAMLEGPVTRTGKPSRDKRKLRAHNQRRSEFMDRFQSGQPMGPDDY